MRSALLVFVVAALAAWTWPASSSQPSPRDLPGWPRYERLCLACHGADGDGRGPAGPYTRVLPRDLTRGEYKWRSAAESLPTDDDLRAVIRHGAPGTSMPAFPLTDAETDELVAIVKAFAPATWTPAPLRGRLVLTEPTGPTSAERGATLWAEQGCASSACHLAGVELHRPRAPGGERRAAFVSISTGLAGTAMPSYGDALPEDDRWALADHVLRIAREPGSTMSRQSIARDHATPLDVGSWPGQEPSEWGIFGGPIPPQGEPPSTLAPAQASLAARQCARCHAKQFREWEPSRHHGATSPGLAAQMMPLSAERKASCLRCHAPLAEQRTDEVLQADGASCAGCHVRSWTRHGPPSIAPSLLSSPSYPLTTLSLYERSDFCAGCHQLPPRTAVGGKPLLDTYREWLEGPYMPRGIQCQHCHMPNREHTFLGVHDPETFRQGFSLEAFVGRQTDEISATASMRNVGAGHYLPTTPTPSAWLTIELRDATGAAIPGGRVSKRIGRDVYNDGTWREGSDTRIPPGGTLTLAYRWGAGPIASAATTARITVEVHPDDYYERLYQVRLRGKLPAARRVLYEEALRRALANHYIAETRDVPIR